MSSNKNEPIKCVNCGGVKDGNQIVGKSEFRAHSHGAFYGDDCPECHGTQWYRMGDETIVISRNERPARPARYDTGIYQCVGCGEKTETKVDLDEPPTCMMCGALDWEKIPI